LLRKAVIDSTAMYLQIKSKSKPMRYIISTLCVFAVLFFSFSTPANHTAPSKETATVNVVLPVVKGTLNIVSTRQGEEFVNYAKTFIGTPYLYGSVDPTKGLDCSGFINCVAKHFNIKVPRSSVEFTNVGTTIETNNAQPGDLILFTGTDASKKVVGHIGIVSENNNGDLQFIHSSSGKANGVTISNLEGYYTTRLMKIIRIFPTA
jgi:cell wall-associated NlpC family hydrolase